MRLPTAIALFALCGPAVADDREVDSARRFRHCVIGTIVEDRTSFRDGIPRAQLLGECLSDLPHGLSNLELEAELDWAIRTIRDFEENAYMAGEDAGREASENHN